MRNVGNLQRIFAAVLTTSVSFSGLAIADDYYFRVKAPTLGEITNLTLAVSGDAVGMVGHPFHALVSVRRAMVHSHMP